MYSVYKISNDINAKIYIGQTTETLDKRFKRHCGYQLKDGTYLHNAMKKYGIEHFSIELVEIVQSQKQLDEKEYYWIQFYDSIKYGYNLKKEKGKCGGDTLSNHPNIQEIKNKISKSKEKEKNPNSIKVKAINIKTSEEKIFNSMKECQIYFNIHRHDIISRRCRNIIKKPYKDILNFEYIK